MIEGPEIRTNKTKQIQSEFRTVGVFGRRISVNQEEPVVPNPEATTLSCLDCEARDGRDDRQLRAPDELISQKTSPVFFELITRPFIVFRAADV